MNRRFIVIVAVVLVLSLTGCAAWKHVARDDMMWRSGAFEARLPRGWMRGPSFGDNLLFLTRDGGGIQSINVARWNLKNELGISMRKIALDMLPQEIAETLLNEWKLERGASGFYVDENVPVVVDGVEGFKIKYGFKNGEGVGFKFIFYGFIFKKRFYSVRFGALEQHHYNRDLPSFEAFMESLNIKK